MNCIKEIEEKGLSVEQYEECLSLIIDKKINHSVDIDWQEICDRYNLSLNKDSLRKANDSIFGGAFVAKYIEQKCSESNNSEHDDELSKKLKSQITVNINKDGTQSSNRLLIMSEEESKDPDYILKAHGFDTKTWKLVSARNTIREAVTKDEGIKTLYASYITVKPDTDINLDKINDFYKNMVNNYQRPKIYNSKSNDGLMLEVPIFDLHFGKLSFSEDVAEHYNYNLARERFNFIIDDVISSLNGVNISKIIFPVGSDFFHIDNYQNTTTAGTKQDSDLSPQLIFNYGVELLIDGISKLSEIAPVEVFCVNGNHDFLTSYHAICTLWAYFNNNDNVNVSKDTSPRKYVEFGNCLIGFCHGDKEKDRLSGIMQIEQREAWGRTLYHEFHSGHLHSEQTKEINGVIIRNLSSVTGTDAWHHNSGYVGSQKKCQSFLWDKETGLKNIIISVIK